MKKTILTTALALTMLSNSAYAALTCMDDAKSGMITVEGFVSQTEVTNIISFDIQNKDGENIYTKAIPTADGSFKYQFKFPDDAETGRYTFTFNSYGKTAPEAIEYNYISPADMTVILSEFNMSGTREQMCELVAKYMDALAIDEKWYNMMTSDDLNIIADAILDGGEYESLEDVRDVAKKIISVKCVANSSSAEVVKDVFSEFSEYYLLKDNTSLYNEYEAASDKIKNAVYLGMASGVVDTMQDVYTLFDESVLLALISNAEQPSDILKLIEDNRNIIPFSMDIFDKSNKSATVIYLEGKQITSMSLLERYIQEAYRAQSSVNVSSPSGGSSGGGGSSGNSSVPNLPAVTPVVDKKTGFDDLEGVAWARDAINYLADKGIVSGISDNEFAPNETLTREQFAMMIVNAFNLTDNNSEADFSDVSKEHWAYRAVASAYSAGIVNGMDDGSFGLGQKIKRQDIAVMIMAAVKKTGIEFDSTKDTLLSDIDSVSEYARESVEYMVRAGVINGFAEDNTFRPFGNTTRAQAAVIIYTVLQGGKVI